MATTAARPRAIRLTNRRLNTSPPTNSAAKAHRKHRYSTRFANRATYCSVAVVSGHGRPRRDLDRANDDRNGGCARLTTGRRDNEGCAVHAFERRGLTGGDRRPRPAALYKRCDRRAGEAE